MKYKQWPLGRLLAGLALGLVVMLHRQILRETRHDERPRLPQILPDFRVAPPARENDFVRQAQFVPPAFQHTAQVAVADENHAEGMAGGRHQGQRLQKQ